MTTPTPSPQGAIDVEIEWHGIARVLLLAWSVLVIALAILYVAIGAAL